MIPPKKHHAHIPVSIFPLFGLVETLMALVYLMVQSSTRAIYFPKRTPMAVYMSVHLFCALLGTPVWPNWCCGFLGGKNPIEDTGGYSRVDY